MIAPGSSTSDAPADEDESRRAGTAFEDRLARIERRFGFGLLQQQMRHRAERERSVDASASRGDAVDES